MALLCSLSSEPCVEPVATKNGEVYERRLIEKHIAATGVDPVTKQPISVSDLIPLKVMPSPSVMRPKSAAQQGIPAMLQSFQAEWDAMMLEVFTLRQQLSAAQQELSNALYQQDAAQRVITRLLKEREQYKKELSSARTTSAPENGMDVDNNTTGSASSAPVLSSALVKRIEAKTAELSAIRETRKIGPSVATVAQVPTYTSQSQHTPHKSGIIHALDVVVFGVGADGSLSDSSGELAVSGSADKSIVVLDKKSGEKLATLTGGFKKMISGVRAVALPSSTSAPSQTVIRIAASSDDGSMCVWDAKVDAKGALAAFTQVCTAHAGSAITSLDIHPIGDLVVIGLANGSLAMFDVSSQTLIASEAHTHLPSSSALSDVKFHPDGEIFATASESGAIHVWSVASLAHLAAFEGHTASVVGLCFSENGFSLASASLDQTLRVWDLQEIGLVVTTQLAAKPTSLAYDLSGRFLAVSIAPSQAKAAREIRVFSGRKCDLTCSFELDAKDVHALRWTHNAKGLVFAQDKSVHFWGTATQ